MKIVLKTETSIFQSPRRLAMPEKMIVENQLEEWLREGIIRPSSSEYLSCSIGDEKRWTDKTAVIIEKSTETSSKTDSLYP